VKLLFTKALLVVTVLLVHPVALSVDSPDVQVLGLFKNAVILDIDGRHELLKVGEVTVEGVKLVAADSKSATIEIDGTVSRLDLSRRVSGKFAVPERTLVSIPQNNRGHYTMVGSINGQLVRFLVDTGATTIAINSKLAAQLGLKYDDVMPVRATTAGGEVQAWKVNLDSVALGGIKLTNIRAVVIEGNYPADVLLGMSFLDNVEMQESSGILLLESKL